VPSAAVFISYPRLSLSLNVITARVVRISNLNRAASAESSLTFLPDFLPSPGEEVGFAVGLYGADVCQDLWVVVRLSAKSTLIPVALFDQTDRCFVPTCHQG